MDVKNTDQSRRAFLKTSVAGTGGLLLSFSWLSAQTGKNDLGIEALDKTIEISGHILINTDNTVVIYSQNPEIGQNVKTSMPMVIAEELDVAWKDVTVAQATIDSKKYTRQVAGGSQSIRKSWWQLRKVGASARLLLLQAAAKKWDTDITTLKTEDGYVLNKKGEKLSYGSLASEAVHLKVPEKVVLKKTKDFKIIGKPLLNVASQEIVSGKARFGIDTQREGMVYARIMHAPGFGMKLQSFDATEAIKLKGVRDVFEIENKVVLIADSTWQAIQGLNVVTAKWSTPVAAEDTKAHRKKLLELVNAPSKKPKVNVGDVDRAFSKADYVLERTYEAPFLPHNTMEPMNFFANVTDEKVELYGPIQTPENQRKAVAKILKRNEAEVTIGISRIGGGFGRRLNGDFVIEAAQISDKIRKPVQLIYTREDDMTSGVYRPASTYKIKAGIQKGNLSAYHMSGAGINMRNTVRPGTWPQGTLADFKLESQSVQSPVTFGYWRAPTSNFLAFAEQCFIDELAVLAKKDPIAFRMDSLRKGIESPVGKLRFDPLRMVGVLTMVAEKSDWATKKKGVFKGVSVYYSHNTYVAEVAEIILVDEKIKIERIVVATDCGIVVNASGAHNQAMGGVVDGIGHAMYGELTLKDGVPEQNNFDTYKMLRNFESPKVETYFVENQEAPSGMGEPTLPPAAAALANAIYAATGKRLYSQPFNKQGIEFVE